jgi:hypothetical protein
MLKILLLVAKSLQASMMKMKLMVKYEIDLSLETNSTVVHNQQRSGEKYSYSFPHRFEICEFFSHLLFFAAARV